MMAISWRVRRFFLPTAELMSTQNGQPAREAARINNMEWYRGSIPGLRPRRNIPQKSDQKTRGTRALSCIGTRSLPNIFLTFFITAHGK